MSTLLQHIQGPQDLKKLALPQLRQLAQEIRDQIIEVVSRNGGHLASNLGVVELTIALHYCLDLPKDRLVLDVGHQCYPHKLLTGRAERFGTLRQAGGISGFPSPTESEFDLFHVGHAGTAIATALGLAKADELLKRTNRTVAIVGDASIVNGVAFEGLNQLNMLRRQFLVVLNDNSMGIAQTQGSLADYLGRFRVSQAYEVSKRRAKRMFDRLGAVGKPVYNALEHLRHSLKATLVPSQIWEPMGLVYIGPLDGHNLDHLVELITVLKDVQHPVLLHVHTNKGQGCSWAEAEPTTFHSPSPFEIMENGEIQSKGGSDKTFTDAFSDALIDLAQKDERIVALTAAMPDGTGLKPFAEAFPDRCLDIGMAESATVDVAAGLCKAGLKPVVAIYSTFMQRSFDQVFQEMSLQNLPVVLCMDRAGLVGGDGAVHHGFLDIAFLRALPRMVLMAPADEAEMHEALKFATACDRPTAIRYPRDRMPAPLATETTPFQLGKAVPLRTGEDATILGYGAQVSYAMQAARLLAQRGVEATVYNGRFAQPLDDDMLRAAFTGGKPVLTVEDHSVAGGFGSAVLERATALGLPVAAGQFVRLGIPADQYVPQGSRSGQLRQVGIDAEGIAQAVLTMLSAETTAKRRTSGMGAAVVDGAPTAAAAASGQPQLPV
jgi:1-deoxy-D-xylulose-5-phosphate synthase